MTNVPEFEREDYPYYEKGMELKQLQSLWQFLH